MLTFEIVVDRLVDGLEYSKVELVRIRKWLKKYQEKNNMTLQELDDLCFEDSEWIFNQIFGW